MLLTFGHGTATAGDRYERMASLAVGYGVGIHTHLAESRAEVRTIDERGKMTLISRNGLDLLAKFPDMEDLARAFSSVPIVVDGEIVSLDKKGRSDFQRLQYSGKERVALTYVAFDVPLRTFCDMQLVDWGDLSTGLAKCAAYGAAIPVVSGYCGLSTFGGSEGVGWATTRAVVSSSLAVIVLNAVISTASLLLFGTR